MILEKLENLAESAVDIAKVIGLAALALLVILCAITWFLWVFGKGRWHNAPSDRMSVFGEWILNVLNDFRHLLALVVMLVVGVMALAGVVLAGSLSELVGFVRDIMSYVGGLVGAIIGYYFGERAGTHSPSANTQSRELEQRDEVTEVTLPNRADGENS